MKEFNRFTQSLAVPFAVAMGLMLAGGLSAQTVVVLPNSQQETVLTADVHEQARVTVPAGVSFSVTDISASTAAAAAAVTIDNIVMASSTKQLKVSVQASAVAFTPSVAEAVTWSAGDVSWGAASWTNATGASGVLSQTVYNEVATCAADTASCSTTGLVFTLASKETVKRSGNHTLSLTWKFESVAGV